MNYAESFQEFSSKLGPKDLALYAGIGIVLWVLFKDKLSPIQEAILKLTKKVKLPNVSDVTFVTQPTPKQTDEQQLFFDLVSSWKQTRDLAVQSGCEKAVSVADEMFPYLSPTICSGEGEDNG